MSKKDPDWRGTISQAARLDCYLMGIIDAGGNQECIHYEDLCETLDCDWEWITDYVKNCEWFNDRLVSPPAKPIRDSQGRFVSAKEVKVDDDDWFFWDLEET